MRLGSAAHRKSAEEAAHFAATWRAALSALTSLGLVQRLGGWFVAANATLDASTLPAPSAAAVDEQSVAAAVPVDVVATVPLAQSRNFAVRVGRLQRKRNKHVRRVLKRLEKARDGSIGCSS